MMAKNCPRCGGEIGRDGSCPRCAGNKTQPGGLLARRKAELDARWRQRVDESGLVASPVETGFLESPTLHKSAPAGQPANVGGNNELPQKRVDADVERVRFSGESRFAEVLSGMVDVPVLTENRIAPDADEYRRELKINSLMLTDTMAPGLHMTAKALAHYFSIDEPIEIYQTAGEENAVMHFVLSPVVLGISGQLLPRTDELMLRALVGHELGHYLAHGQRNPLRDANFAGYKVIRYARMQELPEGYPKQYPTRKELAAAYPAACSLSMAKEVTADRYGLLAARSLDAALRLEMTMVSGLSSDAIIFDTASYLDHARELMEHALENDEPVNLSTHPEHSLRAYATWLFSESDVFKQLTGTGTGRLSLAEVDAKLLTLLGMPQLVRNVEPDSRVSKFLETRNSVGQY